jgi:GNAT superfamily N-acetyltransferase
MANTTFEVRPPQTPAEWESYFNLRFDVLRAAWGQPKGSETDSDDNSSTHAAIIVPDVGCVAAGRLHALTDRPGVAQIRYMAVHPAYQGKGLGAKVVAYLEVQAKAQGFDLITLNARETAVPFYLKCGYSIISEGPLVWGVIPHKICTKTII